MRGVPSSGPLRYFHAESRAERGSSLVSVPPAETGGGRSSEALPGWLASGSGLIAGWPSSKDDDCRAFAISIDSYCWTVSTEDIEAKLEALRSDNFVGLEAETPPDLEPYLCESSYRYALEGTSEDGTGSRAFCRREASDQ